VGYRVFAPMSLIAGKNVGEEVELYLFEVIRDDTDDLYGFESPASLEIFELLLSVSGVGPKVALAICNQLSREKILSAITRSDPAIFRSVSGVGAKVAAKIIVELKNKVSGDSSLDLLPEEDETVEALVGLGYRKSEIIPLMRNIPSGLTTTEEKIKFILSHVGKTK